MNKDSHIISELNGFFAESDNTKAIQGIKTVMVLFPFIAVKNGYYFTKSVLGQVFACGSLRMTTTRA